MNAVGIDVSKGKSTVAVIQPFGVVIAEPFDVSHTESDLNKLVQLIKSLSGETKVVMEYTGAYYEPIANALHNHIKRTFDMLTTSGRPYKKKNGQTCPFFDKHICRLWKKSVDISWEQ